MRFNIGDWKHLALRTDGQPQQNTAFQLESDTTLYDTIPGWLNLPQTARQSVEMQVATYAHDTISVVREVLPTHQGNTEEAP